MSSRHEACEIVALPRPRYDVIDRARSAACARALTRSCKPRRYFFKKKHHKLSKREFGVQTRIQERELQYSLIQ
jgi:hypothetical protein